MFCIRRGRSSLTVSLQPQRAETVLTVELKSHGNGTHLYLTHAGFPDENSRNQHEQAWPLVLEQLDKSMMPDR
ncbi:SRPBCC family protein [Paenibacillus peoriae]|uniref:SRPBCC family protein n=1 Tax=Paenibacillus peoriae TaxID=59893 RepID=UPI00208FFB1A|nr:SRPBCC domain-containing protein [Paenibacillus peoriae]